MRSPRRPLAVLALTMAIALPGCIDAIDQQLRAADVEPPRWEPGDWWVYRVTSALYGTDVEVNVTVAEVNGSSYLLGYPAATPLEALLFHMPALGPVQDDLSWDVHGETFRPISWPLEDGKSWDTTWIAADVHLTAKLEGSLWSISNQGYEGSAGGITYNLTYDPDARWFRNFTRTDLATGTIRQAIELVSHGRGARDPVLAPTRIEVAFLESRTQAAFPAPGATPARPDPSFTLPEPPAENMTVLAGCIIGGAPGRYQAQVSAPSGAAACARSDDLPSQDDTFRLHVAEVPYEAGTWTTQLVAVGEGTATAEVLTYPTRQVTPS